MFLHRGFCNFRDGGVDFKLVAPVYARKTWDMLMHF